MSRATVLLITTSYPTTGDGSEAAGAFVADLVETLTKSVDIRVVAPGTSERPERHGDVQVWHYNGGSAPLSLLRASNPLHWPRILLTLRSMRRQAIEAAGDGKVSRILALWVLPSGWVARTVARRWGIGYFVWALGSDIWSLGKLPLVRSLLNAVVRDSERALADGLLLAREAGELTGRQFEFVPTTRAIGPGNANRRYRGGPQRLLFLGRWHLNKGIDLLLEALSSLEEDDWRLIDSISICGGGPLEQDVARSVAELRAAGREVTLTGYLDKRQATDAMLRADWLVIPSRIESIPVVFSDAMKLGLPVVSTPVGDLRELVASGTGSGILAEEVSAPAIKTAIAAAVRADPRKYYAGVRAMATNFDLEQISRCLLQGVDPGIKQAGPGHE